MFSPSFTSVLTKKLCNQSLGLMLVFYLHPSSAPVRFDLRAVFHPGELDLGLDWTCREGATCTECVR